MSRLFGLVSEEPVKLSCTQDSRLQSGDTIDEDSDKVPGADGWGIGFYRDQGSFLFKKASRTARTQRIASISEVVSSNIFICHLRHATTGDRKEANTHPFRWGFWLFAHLGGIHHFRRIRSRILRKLPPAYKKQIRGNTDSEYCFFLYLTLLRGQGAIKKGSIPLQAAVNGLKNFGRIMEEFHKEADVQQTPVLNFLITNGSYLIATRCGYPLYYLYHGGGALNETTYASDETSLRYELLQYDSEKKFVVVSSEKLSASQDWREVPEKHILAINSSQEIEIIPWL